MAVFALFHIYLITTAICPPVQVIHSLNTCLLTIHIDVPEKDTI